MANTLQTIFIARNKKHTTTYTNIHITSYRQTDAEHGTMFNCANLEPTWSKNDHTLSVQHSVIQEILYHIQYEIQCITRHKYQYSH